MTSSERNEAEYQEYVDQYMHGYCMFLASALHHAYGFPVGVLTVLHNGVERLSHAWVVLPNGRHLDIQGEQSLDEVTYFKEDAPGRYKIYCPTTFAHLQQLSGTALPPDEPDVSVALDVANLYLSREIHNGLHHVRPEGKPERLVVVGQA